jgi:hypothetical protein
MTGRLGIRIMSPSGATSTCHITHDQDNIILRETEHTCIYMYLYCSHLILILMFLYYFQFLIIHIPYWPVNLYSGQ